jgi:hypothetical protein
MTASKLSRGIDVRVGSDCRFDSSYKQWNAVRGRQGGESDAVPRSSQRSALLAGISLLLAGLTTGCDIAGPQDETGVVAEALVLPPPVNQNIGFYDRDFLWFESTDCLGCHDPTTTDPTTVSDVVSLRHHIKLPPGPLIIRKSLCTPCHWPDGTGFMRVILDCPTCHTSEPHHKSAPTQARQCAACHGSVVNNFDDGHYIPTYKKSITTPDPICRTWNDAAHTTCASGGCRACHVASTSVTPNTSNNVQTHHGTGLGQGGAGSRNPLEQCGWCHNIKALDGVPTPAIDMRTCETCHGPTSLHAIQYNGNRGSPGFGHVGASFDCWGCHGHFFVYALPPSFGPTIPTIDFCEPLESVAGVPTQVCCTGQSITNTVVEQYRTYHPTVVLSRLDDARSEVASLVITPITFRESEVCFTATLPAGIYNVRINKDYQGSLEVKSNVLPIVVRPRSQACVDPVRHVVRVTREGLGCPVSVFVAHNLRIEQCVVSSCSNTTIVANCPSAAVGDKLVVAGDGPLFSATLTLCP